MSNIYKTFELELEKLDSDGDVYDTCEVSVTVKFINAVDVPDTRYEPGYIDCDDTKIEDLQELTEALAEGYSYEGETDLEEILELVVCRCPLESADFYE